MCHTDSYGVSLPTTLFCALQVQSNKVVYFWVVQTDLLTFFLFVRETGALTNFFENFCFATQNLVAEKNQLAAGTLTADKKITKPPPSANLKITNPQPFAGFNLASISNRKQA